MSSDPSVLLWRRTSRALDGLLGRPSAEVVADLARLAAEDSEVHREVVALLAADPGTGSFLAGAVGRAAAAVVTPAPEGEPPEQAAGEATVATIAIDGWRLVRLLGRGGMGEVYLAERAGGEFEQQAALKLVRRGLDSEEILARFLRERQILARLTHPGIARLLDGGMAPDGRPYFVLEKVEGEPITHHVAGRGLGPRAVLRLFLRVLDAVEAAHRSLVVHRDLKPSNLFVTPEGDVKLLDFGIAKLLGDPCDGHDGEATRTGSYPLTPAYAAPEQILTGEVSTATDVYALGVVLYELLAGERPLARAARTPAELAREVAQEAAPLPSEAVRRRARSAGGAVERGRLLRRARELAGDLDAVLLRALAPDPARRYPTVGAFARDLKAFLDGRPVAARGEARGYRTRKLLRRHRLALCVAALVVLSLAGGLMAALWQARRAERAAQRAERTQELLVGLFEAVDPSHAQGASVTARELLDQGALRLEHELGAEPEVRAILADTLARTYLGLGVLDQAARWADRAVAERRRGSGAGAPATLLAELTRAEVRIYQGGVERSRAVASSYLQLALDEEARGTPQGLAEGRRYVDLAVASLRGQESDPLRLGQVLAASGRIAAGQGDAERARRELEQAERLLAPLLVAEGPTRRQLAEDLARLGR